MNNSHIKELLKKIYYESEHVKLYPSLIGGGAGVALFKVLYQKHFSNAGFDDQIIMDIQDLAEKNQHNENITFAIGQSGVSWFFLYLFKADIISQADFKALCTNDDFLKSKSLALTNIILSAFLNFSTFPSATFL